MKKNFVCFWCLVSCILYLVSCRNNRFDIDVSNIDADVKIRRMEKEFFSANPDSLNEVHQQLLNEYGTFYKRYIVNIIGIGMVNDPAIAYSLKTFLSDKYVREVYDDTEKKYNDELKDVHDELTDAFKHCKFYFPAMTVPDVVTYVSGFQYAVAVTDSILGIGLDMYLGSDYENYPKAGFPLYKINLMKRDYMVVDAMKSWLMTEFYSDGKKQPKDMLSTMIQYGKILFLLDAIIPQTPDSIKIGYSAAQMDWCEKNEFNVWAHIVDKELLYTTEQQTITKFFNEAPFTSGLPQESPPKVGVWVGWKIIRSYMENNSDVSLANLMQNENAQEILNKSKYKPRK